VVPEQMCLQQPFELSETITLSYHVTRLYCSVSDVCEYPVNLITVVIDTYLSLLLSHYHKFVWLSSISSAYLILTATAVLSSETPNCC